MVSYRKNITSFIKNIFILFAKSGILPPHSVSLRGILCRACPFNCSKGLFRSLDIRNPSLSSKSSCPAITAHSDSNISFRKKTPVCLVFNPFLSPRKGRMRRSIPSGYGTTFRGMLRLKDRMTSPEGLLTDV